MVAAPHPQRPFRRAGRLIAACAALAVLASPPAAHALIVKGAGGEVGIQYRAPVVRKVEALHYHGGPVVTASDTYAIYWDPVGAYRSDWMTLIDRYFHDAGADSGKLTNVFSVDSQYTGPAGTRAAYQQTFRGAYTDPDPYPIVANCTDPKSEPVCLTDAQIRSELQQFVAANHLPTGVNAVYFVLTPPGVTVCTDNGHKGNCSDSTTTLAEEEEGVSPNGICSYHSAIEPGSLSPIVYAVQPWVAGNAGFVLKALAPLETEEPSADVLACQNSEALVEPNQTGARSPFGDYETGLADVIIADVSAEQSNIVGDPLLNGWYQSATFAEQADMCQYAFGPPLEGEAKPAPTTHALFLNNQTINNNHYYLPWAFSSVGVTSGKGIVCWEADELTPHFTAPNPVNIGDIVGFDANESGMALDANLTKLGPEEPFTAPVYKWEFGDGTAAVTGTGYASIFHSYAAPGSYSVTLTVTDSGGNTATYTNSITVVGSPTTPGETPGGGPSGSGGPAATTSAGTTLGSDGKTTTLALSAPKVTEKIGSRQLAKVLRLGLAVRYSVNEQVAGGVEVMIARRLARRLGIHGLPAHRLPKGYPRSIVVGAAVLVTTTAGHGTVRIRFSQPTAERLALLRRVKLTLRIVVRNADRQHPKTTTLLSTVVLKG